VWLIKVYDGEKVMTEVTQKQLCYFLITPCSKR
jgi:hypothetical protein